MNYPAIKITENTPPESIHIDKDLLFPSVTSETMHNLIEVRANSTSNLFNHAFYLDPNVDWVIGNDNQGIPCLIPLRKPL